MGFVAGTGFCYVCNRIVFFNPRSVPSVESQPICPTCVSEINRMRAEEGLEPIVVASDAYAPEVVQP